MDTTLRREQDSVGRLDVAANAYYGIHALRAKYNFPITGVPMNEEFVGNIVLIKKAVATVHKKSGALDERLADAVIAACDDLLAGEKRDQFIVDAVQGGAGTSANMNVNEVVANLAIEKLGGTLGDYSLINPNDHINMGQSTNDVIPTAGKLTVLALSRELREQLRFLIRALLNKSEEFDDILKMGRTQLQDAVPMRLGQSFRAFASAMERDLGRIERVLEEMRSVNIGATAIGTAINADMDYFKHIIDELSILSGEPLVRPEDLFDATQNADCFASVSGVLKAFAINLTKMCNDLRLMSGGPRTGLSEIHLPPKQNGSSIMPGKINPVIPEVVNQVAFLVIGHDMTVTLAAQAGQLELNAFEPVIFYQLFESMIALTGAIKTLRENCIDGIVADRENCRLYMDRSVGIVTALNPYIGYQKASEIAKESLRTGKRVWDIVLERGLLDEATLRTVLDAHTMTEPHDIEIPTSK